MMFVRNSIAVFLAVLAISLGGRAAADLTGTEAAVWMPNNSRTGVGAGTQTRGYTFTAEAVRRFASRYGANYVDLDIVLERARVRDFDQAWAHFEQYNSIEVSHALDDYPSSRTVQRWLRRASHKALEIQQTIRNALIERCEPRPVEHIFPRGLSPPESLTRRRWRDPEPVATLHRALTILFAGAIKLELPTAVLLAEARGR